MGYSLSAMGLFGVVVLYLVPDDLIKPFGSRKTDTEKTRHPRDSLFKGTTAEFSRPFAATYNFFIASFIASPIFPAYYRGHDERI